MMKHTIRHAVAAALLLTALTGCQSRSNGPESGALVKVGFELTTTEYASLVSTVRLIVSYSDGAADTIPLQLRQGEVVDTVIVVPDEEVTFTLQALSGTGTLLYEGQATATVPGGQQVEVDLLLEPPADLLMLRAGPFFQSTSLGTTEMQVFIDVHNVEELFGASFRVKYDTLLLDLVEFAEGDFLKSDGEPLLTTAFPVDDTAGVLACVVTRQLRDDESVPPGITGSGRLLTLTFAPKRAGQGIVEFVTDRSLPALRDPELNLVNRYNSLVLESATFSVEEGP